MIAQKLQQRYGPPSLTIGAFRLWVHGYQAPEAARYGDANWLVVTACYDAAGDDVGFLEYAAIETLDLMVWLREANALLAGERDDATLAPVEELIHMVMVAEGSQRYRCLLTLDTGQFPGGDPDKDPERQWEFELTAEELQAVVDRVALLHTRYPVRVGH